MTRKTGCLFVVTSGDLAGMLSCRAGTDQAEEEVGHCLSEECQPLTVGVQSCSFRIFLPNHKLGQKILAGRVTLLYECLPQKNSPIHSNHFNLSLCCRKMFFQRIKYSWMYRNSNLIKCKFNAGSMSNFSIEKVMEFFKILFKYIKFFSNMYCSVFFPQEARNSFFSFFVWTCN